MNECVIYEEDRPVGRLCWQSDGLRWHFQARVRACPGVRHLFVTDAQGSAVRLGVPEPSGDGMLLQRTLTRQGLDGLALDASCRAELRRSDAPPVPVKPEQAPCTDQEASVPQAAALPEAAAKQDALRLYREEGLLYVGEPFAPDRPLVLNPVFQKMVLREIDGVLHWLLPLG